MARVTIAGQTLTDRVWWLLRDARASAGLPAGAARVMQGSFNAGRVGASAGTHDQGGAFDLSVAGLTEAEQLRLVHELRRRNVVAWIRSPKFGWTSTGPHIHGIVRDEPGLSVGARRQVEHYDANRNGLANRRPDPHPRPRQYPTEEVALMDWPVGKRKMVKPAKAVNVPGGRWVTLATITLPKGAAFECSLQVRMPVGVAAGEAHLGRVGWGTVTGTKIDETGHNPVAPASAVERWRTPIVHNIVGGGPLAYRLWLPPRKDGRPHAVRFVAKAIRTR